MEPERSVPVLGRDFDSFGPDLMSTSLPMVNRLSLSWIDPHGLVSQVKNSVIPLPFPCNFGVPIPEKVYQDYCHGKSKIKLRKRLVEDILNPPKALNSLTPSKRYEFLVERARTLRGLTDEMFLEFKYPKPLEGKVKASVDDEADWRRICKLEKTGDSELPATFSGDGEKGPGIRKRVENAGADGTGIGKQSSPAPEPEDCLDDEGFECQLKRIFGKFRLKLRIADDITPLPELSLINSNEFWQFRAKRSLEPRKKAPKRFWKRNPYPPKTFDERIKEMREKVAEENGDQMSGGIWNPVYMISEFEITGINYNKPILHESPIQPLDWYTLYDIRKKCSDWLNRNEKFL